MLRKLLILFTVCTAASQIRADVPVPAVTGPVKVTAKAPDPSHGYPFNSSAIDLSAKGYVEEEFFIEGAANRYTLVTGATGSVADSGHHYKTRVVVRRPATAKKTS